MGRAKFTASSSKATAGQKLLFDQLQQIAQGLGETFAPFCEVVLHDLTDPKQAIVAIHNNLSGRKVGQGATELGLARIADPDYAQVISNYANSFADGRQAKSTSIGIKGADGSYVAALCLNVDLTLFQGLQSAIGQFVSVDANNSPREQLIPVGADAIRAHIDQFAARRATTPRALNTEDRRALLHELRDAGCMQVRRSSDIIAAHLGVSRATVYADAR
ncbi:helix-turn-helix transcriptional regulator [Bradyrhizobium japonicum]|jgi:predicted transcriptional regulator YheO|uniref:Transcriptional regulator YheO n=1 Tax=Bradyrhizobium japonicum TaxID=375 RepID=A0ABV2RN60_BRAJP|nr:helix-turn-helix transcriptional regulator [Bradyrhizobium japonicum]MCP1763073.1 putative transcriptional regulator YheO [Bradyrhizobium japonicum]MCP1785207.1 putative transcriptional regulator YheO [Bradyrhizobium japonicum]MCP1807088.1 putative transcriptional regulator YheO [Bradyrhizobium japonicum]MCP1816013.1 putative transcriptional regulator YheO [Bradyrhizobium japonicum]MCP1872471.1 putative transcriptional regulator YheO [Bradyrhizobium japonicum]